MYSQTTETKVSQKIFVPAVCNALYNFPFNSIKPCTLMSCALIWPWPHTLMSWTTRGSLAVLLDYSLPKLASLWPLWPLWPPSVYVLFPVMGNSLKPGKISLNSLCVHAMLNHFSCFWPFVSLWIVACQATLSVGILQAKILKWVAMPSLPGGSSWPRDWICASYDSCVGKQVFFFFFFYQQCHLGSPQFTLANINWTSTINKAVNYFHTAVLSKGLHPEYWNADWFPTVLLANPWLSRTYSGTAVCSGLWSPHSCQSSAIMWPSVDKLITARRFLTDSDGCCLAI